MRNIFLRIHLNQIMSKDYPEVKKQKTTHREIVDSSDDEKIKDNNNNYSLAEALRNSRSSITDLAQDFDLESSKVEKSFLLHSVGRMLIYSPKVDAKYRTQKERLLYTQNSRANPYTLDSEGKIDSEALDIKVRNLEDLLALGRLMRRSQVRTYLNINDSDGVIETRAAINMSSNNNATRSTVIEDLVVSYKGFARGRQKRGEKYKPNTDIVQLGLEDERGDYPSAYRGNRYNRGKSSVTQVLEAGSSVLKGGDLEEKGNEELESAITTIGNLREKISEKFPDSNNDAFIADSIRKVCRGEPLFELSTSQDIQHQIYSLTYLLFKTEVYRSPAALVGNIQMLDLIINGEMSFDDAFVKKEMPMSPQFAIRAARSLEKDYKHAFYDFENPYNYAPGYEDKEGKKNLVNRESNLMDKWMKFRFGEEKFNQMQDDVVNNLPEICEEIYGSLQNFGMNLHSPALHRMILPDPALVTSTEEEKDSHPSNSPRSSPVTTSNVVSDCKEEKGSTDTSVNI